MTNWKSPDFKALQETWYRRLEAEGFQDAEKIVGEDMELRQRAAYPYRNKDTLLLKDCYYRLLSQLVHEAEFGNEVHQMIMLLYANGEKIKVICEELSKRGYYRCRGAIRFIIRRYEMKWGVKIYTRRQLNRKVT